MGKWKIRFRVWFVIFARKVEVTIYHNGIKLPWREEGYSEEELRHYKQIAESITTATRGGRESRSLLLPKLYHKLYRSPVRRHRVNSRRSLRRENQKNQKTSPEDPGKKKG